MTKLFTVGLLALLLSSSGFAQQHKGKWLVGGTFGSNSRTGTMQYPDVEDKSNLLYVSPRVGYFLSDRWAVGIAPSFSRSFRGLPNHKHETRTVSVAPFIRNYWPVGDKLSIFGELSGSVDRSTERINKVNGDSTQIENFSSGTTGMGLYLRPGIVYFITPKIGIETSIGSLGFSYATMKGKRETPERTSEMTEKHFGSTVNLNYAFNVGVNFYLGK